MEIIFFDMLHAKYGARLLLTTLVSNMLEKKTLTTYSMHSEKTTKSRLIGRVIYIVESPSTGTTMKVG